MGYRVPAFHILESFLIIQYFFIQINPLFDLPSAEFPFPASTPCGSGLCASFPLPCAAGFSGDADGPKYIVFSSKIQVSPHYIFPGR
jgi:hypothetical protein